MIAMLSNPAWGQINAKLLDGQESCAGHTYLLWRVAYLLADAAASAADDHDSVGNDPRFPRFRPDQTGILIAAPGGRPN